jgi:glycosyltransferase involved in cell wall biosynthesis
MWRSHRRRLVSLILCTKNGMPYVRDALRSVAALRYREYELVVQDCVSTDGTAEFLAGGGEVDRISFVSEPDDGIGDAYNRALARCEGDIIGSIDADNLIDEHALDVAVSTFEANPKSAALYGNVLRIDATGKFRKTFEPGDFDASAVLRCELVPPFSTAFFSRATCGDELRFDDQLATCADYDLWLRLSGKPIDRVVKLMGSTRLSANSMSRDPTRYEQFCADKIAALTAHIERRPDLAAQRDQAVAGIYCWAAESVSSLKGESALFARFVGLAGAHDPLSERYRRLAGLDQIAVSAEL